MYINEWKGLGFIDVVADFSGICLTTTEFETPEDMLLNSSFVIEQKGLMELELKKEQWGGIEILLASYGTDDYEYSAFVLFRKNGKLFQVNVRSSTSSYLFEDTWEPEETTVEVLLHKVDTGVLGECDKYHIFSKELIDVLRLI